MAIDPGIRRLVLRTLLAAFRGHTAPEFALELLDDGLAGHTLFGFNVGHTAQLHGLTAALRRARHDVLIAIDEEGGDVTRLGHATGSPYPGNAALGAVDDPALTRRIYRAIGDDLVDVGIKLNLAPTVDVNSTAENPIIGTRSFGADPALVARHSAAAVSGLQEAGVAACAKHFPGHGATVADSHLALPTVDVPVPVLRRRDLPPFAAVVAAGARAVMTAHIRVPALTGAEPATFSPAVLVDLLRGELGFTGAVVTDALEMKGAAVIAGGIGPAAVRALAAGADLLCIGADVDAALVERIVAEIAAALADGRLPRERVEQAAGRVAALADASVPPPAPAGPHRDGSTPVTTGTVAGRGPSPLALRVARRAVRVEGSLAGFGDPFVIQLESASTIAEGRVPWGLTAHLDGVAHLRVVAAETDPARVLRAAAGRPVILVTRNAHRSPYARRLTEGLAAVHPVAVVEMGWPATWRPAGARAFLVTHGASLSNGLAVLGALGLGPVPGPGDGSGPGDPREERDVPLTS